MGYYAGDYYAGDIGALARMGGSALTKLGGKALSFLKSPGGAAVTGAAAGAGAAAALGGEEAPRYYRRMNVLNPRALRRSMRRVQGFAKFARKTMTFTTRHKLKKKGRR